MEFGHRNYVIGILQSWLFLGQDQYLLLHFRLQQEGAFRQVGNLHFYLVSASCLPVRGCNTRVLAGRLEKSANDDTTRKVGILDPCMATAC